MHRGDRHSYSRPDERAIRDLIGLTFKQRQRIRESRRGRKSLGMGDEFPEFGVGDANANCPQILPCFKISSTRLLASQSSKKIANPMTRSNRVFTTFKSTPLANYHFRRKIQYFILARTRTQIPLRMHQNTPFQVKKMTK